MTFIMNNVANYSENKMVFSYQQDNFENLVKSFAQQVNARQLEDRIEYPAALADGYAKARQIEPGFSYLVINNTINADWTYKRIPTKEFRLMLYFYEVQFEDKIYCKINNSVIENTDKFYSIALLTNSQTSCEFKLQKGTKVKALSIEVTTDWLRNNFASFCEEKIKAKDCVIDFISAKQRNILEAIFNDGGGTQFPELFIKSQVMRLTEQFLNTLCTRGLTDIPDYVSQKDFQSLQQIEHILLKNYCGDFPSIEGLSKMAYMSESKLKKLFKKAYGMAPYEFYQKNRMHKAKDMLTKNKQTVSQVGAYLGYQNMSNFSAAFKKEFNVLPSQVHQLV
jgi:AraC-like DNA-binding protein